MPQGGWRPSVFRCSACSWRLAPLSSRRSLAGASSAMYYLLWCLHLARASIRRFLGHSAACGVAAALPILLSIVTTSGHGSWVSLVGAIVSGILALTLSCAVYRGLSTQRKHGGDSLERPTEES